MEFIAHLRKTLNNDTEIQTVSEHSVNTAIYAKNITIKELENTVYLAGLLHDFGKYTEAFKNYIIAVHNKENVRRGSVIHTFQGLKYLFEHKFTSKIEMKNKSATEKKKYSKFNITCEVISYVLSSHHGLWDCFDENQKNGFEHRLNSEKMCYQKAENNFLECNNMEEEKIDEIFEKSSEEIYSIFQSLYNLSGNKIGKEFSFYQSLLARMLLSSLIDGDRRDTIEFMHNTNFDFLIKQHDIKNLWTNCLKNFNKKEDMLDNKLKINKVRKKISDKCLESSDIDNGIYKLSVPTGGGKTLTSLKFALTLAEKKNKKRIFFIIPLLSVLDQNSKDIKDFIGNDEIILEHHSNIIIEKNNENELDKNELLMDTWNSPIVITTLVQFLNTLFSGKTSCIRRMNSLADSIIIIDEVQTVPKKMLTLFNLAMNFLSNICNATIILSSATQPSLEKIEYPMKYNKSPDLVPYDKELYKIFNRTKIINKCRPEQYTSLEISDFSLQTINDYKSNLVICNTKRQAREIYNNLEKNKDENVNVFHLSTSMCMHHRKNTLKKINESLENKEKVICVSTQLVESGVDFSFGSVIRIIAGMESIIQSAGRCNRNHESESLAPVYILNFKDENLKASKYLKDIGDAQDVTRSLLSIVENNPNTIDGNILSEKSISTYYNKIYKNSKDGSFDYSLRIKGEKTSIFNLLSDNKPFSNKNEEYILTQGFKLAGDNFKVFDDSTIDVVVHYGKSTELIADLTSSKAINDFSYKKNIINQLKPFTISLFNYELGDLKEKLEIKDDLIYILERNYYSDVIGFNIEGDEKLEIFAE